jgi:hypothetical protein
VLYEIASPAYEGQTCSRHRDCPENVIFANPADSINHRSTGDSNLNECRRKKWLAAPDIGSFEQAKVTARRDGFTRLLSHSQKKSGTSGVVALWVRLQLLNSLDTLIFPVRLAPEALDLLVLYPLVR